MQPENPSPDPASTNKTVSDHSSSNLSSHIPLELRSKRVPVGGLGMILFLLVAAAYLVYSLFK